MYRLDTYFYHREYQDLSSRCFFRFSFFRSFVWIEFSSSWTTSSSCDPPSSEEILRRLPVTSALALVSFTIPAWQTSRLCGLCMKDSHSPFKAGFSDKSWLESPIHRMKCKKTPRLMSRAEYIPSIIHLSSSFVTRPRLPSSSSNLSRFLERSANNLFTAVLSSDVDNAVFCLNNVFDFSPEK